MSIRLCVMGCLLIVMAGCQAASVELRDVSLASGLPTSGQTSGLVVLDWNQDGTPDLLVGRHAGAPQFYRGRGDLTFVREPGWDVGPPTFDHHATLVDDLDGDGKTDLYFVVGAHRGEGTGENVLVLGADSTRGDAAAAYGVQDPFGRGRGALFLDTDGDGQGELVVLNFKTAARVYSSRTPPPWLDQAEADFGVVPAAPTGDQRYRHDFLGRLLPYGPDDGTGVGFLALGGHPPVRILRRVDARFAPDLAALTPSSYLPEPVGGAWADFDEDGKLDLFLIYGHEDAEYGFAVDRHSRLLVASGSGFNETTPATLRDSGQGSDCVVADFDNDGRPDLLVVQCQQGQNRTRWRLFRNGGKGTFAEYAPQTRQETWYPGVSDGVLAADLDRDGDLDLVMALGAIDDGVDGGGVLVVRNDSRGGNWLALDLGGPPLAYGARVEIMVGGRRLRQQYWPTQVHGSACPLPLHFGLGSSSRATSIKIDWPSGQTTTLEDVSANQVLRIKAP